MRALRDGVQADELAARLADVLRRAEDDSFAWLQSAQTKDDQTKEDTEPKKGTVDLPPAGSRVLQAGSDPAAVWGERADFRTEHPDRAVLVQWQVQE